MTLTLLIQKLKLTSSACEATWNSIETMFDEPVAPALGTSQSAGTLKSAGVGFPAVTGRVPRAIGQAGLGAAFPIHRVLPPAVAAPEQGGYRTSQSRATVSRRTYWICRLLMQKSKGVGPHSLLATRKWIASTKLLWSGGADAS